MSKIMLTIANKPMASNRVAMINTEEMGKLRRNHKPLVRRDWRQNTCKFTARELLLRGLPALAARDARDHG
jgi:hypothetical protein